MPNPTIHIGQLIRDELSRQGRTATWFAAQLGCARTTVYTIFRRDTIDTDLLLRISLILGRNFFTEYSKRLG